MKHAALLAFLLALLAPASAQPVLHVDLDATGANDGTSWADAFTDLQDALALAATLDQDGLQIWVAEGTYFPTDNSDRTVRFELGSVVALFGGFGGTESALDQRDWAANETILSGDLGKPNYRFDNSTFVVVINGPGSTVTLDGFTVEYGYNVSGRGAGIFSTDNHITLRNIRITNHHSDSCGGIYVNGGTVTIVGATLNSNRAVSGPGGGRGGALCIDGAQGTIINSRFTGNWASAVGSGGEFGWARGAAVAFNSSEIGIINSILDNNDLGGQARSGSAIWQWGGQLYLSNSVVVNNQGCNVDNPGCLALDTASNPETFVHNSIVFFNDREGIDVPDHTVIEHSIIQGGSGTDVLDANPLFVDLPAGDFHLQEGSPAVDFGRTEFLPPDTFDLDEDGDTEEPLPIDLEGNPRVQGNAPDLGAYESPFAVALEPGAGVPETSRLAAAYPNPFSQRTTLALDMAEAQDVTVEVFDVLGRRVVTVHDGPLAVGEHRVVIEANGLPAGVYVVRAEGEAFRFAQRVTLVR